MSLTVENFMKTGARLKALFGFNPIQSNRHGTILLYNERITESTSDEEIINIRSAYLKWKSDILSEFEKKEILLTEDEFGELFSTDDFSGTVSFLDLPINVFEDIQKYVAPIYALAKKQRWKKADSTQSEPIKTNI